MSEVGTMTIELIIVKGGLHLPNLKSFLAQ